MQHTVDPQSLLAVTGRWLRVLTHGSKELIALLEPDGRVRFISDNGAPEALTGYAVNELDAQAMAALVHANHVRSVLEAFRAVAAQPGASKAMSFELKHRDGHAVTVEAVASNYLNDELVKAIVVRVCPMGSAVSNVEAAEKAHVQIHDREHFLNAVYAAIGRSKNREDDGFAVLTLEIDRFKVLVGNYGQAVVDPLLSEVARRLARLLRPEDSVAQTGAAEFGILLHATSQRSQAERVVDRIQKTISERYSIDGQSITVSTIIGIATSERNYDRPEQVLRDAAVAAGRARRQRHKRRAVFQTQMRVEDKRYMSLVDELHNALQKGQFCLHYQPIIDLSQKRLSGFEALVRWDHPGRGLVGPGEFIKVAEDTGLIAPLGEFVMREACRQMAEWNRQHAAGSPLYVSVNLSPTQFAEDNLSAQVEQAYTQSGLGANNLQLEITESAVLENLDAATQLLNKLKQKGVKVSLDDFGTGYSSFSHLHQLPYDTLKIDRSFVSRIGSQGEHVEIINAIVVLAHNLRMRVIAEGVETEAQAAVLTQLGCGFAQGYYFARPLDAGQAARLLTDG